VISATPDDVIASSLDVVLVKPLNGAL